MTQERQTILKKSDPTMAWHSNDTMNDNFSLKSVYYLVYELYLMRSVCNVLNKIKIKYLVLWNIE